MNDLIFNIFLYIKVILSSCIPEDRTNVRISAAIVVFASLFIFLNYSLSIIAKFLGFPFTIYDSNFIVLLIASFVICVLPGIIIAVHLWPKWWAEFDHSSKLAKSYKIDRWPYISWCSNCERRLSERNHNIFVHSDEHSSYLICPFCKAKLFLANKVNFEEDEVINRQLIAIDVVSWIILAEGFYLLLAEYFDFYISMNSSLMAEIDFIFHFIWSIVPIATIISAVGIQRLRKWARNMYLAIVTTGALFIFIYYKYLAQQSFEPSSEFLAILFINFVIAIYLLSTKKMNSV